MPKTVNATCKACRLSKLKCDRSDGHKCSRCDRLGLHCIVEARMHGKLNAIARLAPAVKELAMECDDNGGALQLAEREVLQATGYAPPTDLLCPVEPLGALVPTHPAIPRARLPLPQSQLVDRSSYAAMIAFYRPLLKSLAARGERVGYRVLLGECIRLAQAADDAGAMSWALGLAHESALPLSIFSPFRPPASAQLVASRRASVPPFIAEFFLGPHICVCAMYGAEQGSYFSTFAMAAYPVQTRGSCCDFFGGVVHPDEQLAGAQLRAAMWQAELSPYGDGSTRVAEIKLDIPVRVLVPNTHDSYQAHALHGRIAMVESRDELPDQSYLCIQMTPLGPADAVEAASARAAELGAQREPPATLGGGAAGCPLLKRAPGPPMAWHQVEACAADPTCGIAPAAPQEAPAVPPLKRSRSSGSGYDGSGSGGCPSDGSGSSDSGITLPTPFPSAGAAGGTAWPAKPIGRLPAADDYSVPLPSDSESAAMLLNTDDMFTADDDMFTADEILRLALDTPDCLLDVDG